MIKFFTGSELSANDEKQKLKVQFESEQKAIEVWENFLKVLSEKLKKSEVDTWFSVISPKRFENNELTVSVPSADYYGMIERRFNKHIALIVKSGIFGENGSLNYEVVQESLFDSAEEERKYSAEISKEDSAKIIPLLPAYGNRPEIQVNEKFETNLLARHTFENFIKGESNELAVVTAYAITNNLGKSYNPFFLYGGVGLGKTHLMQAIGNEVLRKYPDKRVYYTTTPDFTTQFTTNIAKDRIGSYDSKSGTKQLDAFYKSLDILILDDIQNLGGKPGTQDFMYQIFNTLYNNNKHIIFSCDKPLNQIKDIEERLISRFQWGMIVDIQQPSWEMRVAIIQKKLNENKIEFPEEVIHYVASNIKDSIRSIEGCIVSMIAESILVEGGNINMDIAERVIHKFLGSVRRIKNVTIESIIHTVSKFYKVSENQILTRKRTKEIAFARQVAMYLSKELTTLTFESIGLNFGGKDHATVLYAHKTIRGLIKINQEILSQINQIKEELKHL